MTRPELPPTRDERVALAAHAILRCCGLDDQMDDGFERVLDGPALVEFRVLVPVLMRFDEDSAAAERDAIARAIALNHRASDAIMFDCGFAGISYSLPRKVTDGYVCAIRVPVGAP